MPHARMREVMAFLFDSKLGIRSLSVVVVHGWSAEKITGRSQGLFSTMYRINGHYARTNVLLRESIQLDKRRIRPPRENGGRERMGELLIQDTIEFLSDSAGHREAMKSANYWIEETR